ncbi:MAG: hypothetical protein ACRD26_17750 [Vicinamibacterales bacterium]
MTHPFTRALAILLLMSVAGAWHAAAQTPPAPPKPPADSARAAPVRVQVVIARYQGEKRISSLPYTLSVNAATRGIAQVRMGAEIPISTSVSATPVEGKPAATQAAVNYELIGTQIDCSVRPSPDGRYLVELSISDKSIYANGEGPAVAGGSLHPPFRSFRSVNTVVLGDGQSTQFAAAADRVTGEIVRVEVSLQALK